MHQLEALMTDLYTCLNIPIQILDDELKRIAQIGITSNIQKQLNQTSILNDILSEKRLFNTFTYHESLHFSLFCFYTPKHKSTYLLIGPFCSNPECVDAGLPYRPIQCVPHLNHLIKTFTTQQQQYSKPVLPAYITESIHYIHKHYQQPIHLESLSTHLNLNKSYLSTIFKQYTDMTFTEFLNRFRTEKSKDYLLQSDASIMDIALQVGFNNHTYYSTTFKKLYGMTPLEFRKHYIGELLN